MPRWPAGSPGGVGGRFVSAVELDAFRADLSAAGTLGAAGLRGTVGVSAEAIAESARKIAGEHSTSIPPTIVVTDAGDEAVIEAGSGVPLAALYELGNATRPSPTTFTHPVFGNRSAWVAQPRYPFMAPALEAAGADVEAAVERIADDVVAMVVGVGGGY